MAEEKEKGGAERQKQESRKEEQEVSEEVERSKGKRRKETSIRGEEEKEFYAVEDYDEECNGLNKHPSPYTAQQYMLGTVSGTQLAKTRPFKKAETVPLRWS